jgi:flagellar protein FlaG
MDLRSMTGTPAARAADAASATPAARVLVAAAPESADPAGRDEAVDRANRLIAGVARDLRFQISGQTGKAVVQVIDKETGNLVRQIPAEEMLAIANALDRMQGLMVRLKA